MWIERRENSCIPGVFPLYSCIVALKRYPTRCTLPIKHGNGAIRAAVSFSSANIYMRLKSPPNLSGARCWDTEVINGMWGALNDVLDVKLETTAVPGGFSLLWN